MQAWNLLSPKYLGWEKTISIYRGNFTKGGEWLLTNVKFFFYGETNISLKLNIDSKQPTCMWVIPYKSTEKNVTTFFLDFWPKKSKVFDVLVVKTFFKQNFGYFWPLLEFFKDFFYFSRFEKWDLQYNILFFFFLNQKFYTFCHRSKSL